MRRSLSFALMMMLSTTSVALQPSSSIYEQQSSHHLVCYSCQTVLNGAGLSHQRDPCAFRTADLSIMNCSDDSQNQDEPNHNHHGSYCIFYILRNKLSNQRRFVRSCAPSNKFIYEDTRSKLKGLLKIESSSAAENLAHRFGKRRRRLTRESIDPTSVYDVEYEKECNSMLCNGEFLEKSSETKPKTNYAMIIMLVLAIIAHTLLA